MDIKNKINQILSKMTLKEKIGQLMLFGFGGMDEQGVPKTEFIEDQIEKGLVGTIIQPLGDYSDTIYNLQKIAVEKSRLKIPLLINADLIHGMDTIFPIPLAAACSFDVDLVEKSARAAAFEASSCGIHYTNAPMIDVSRDPRWGRIAESQGEDPYLSGEMAKAYVRGFQNSDQYVMATLKHYAAYGASEGGRDYDIVEVSENVMRNTYLIPFREGVKEGVDSVMTSFNSIEGIPSTGNVKYLRNILRGEFGFEGIVISDAMSIVEMIAHGYCENTRECAYRAIKAGVDIELGNDCYSVELERLVLDGVIQESEVDEAVTRVLEKKFKLGLFDDPYKYHKFNKNCIFSKEHLEISEQLAIESCVLLENNGILPLNKQKKLSIIGKYGNNKELGGCWQYSKRIGDTVTIKDGIEKMGFNIVSIEESYELDKVIKSCSNADAIIFTIGEDQYESGEAHSKHILDLPEQVINCFNEIKKINKNIITLVFSGRPLVIKPFQSSAALVYCWHLGQKAGDSVAKLLIGNENFSGKLSVSLLENTGQIPMYYNRKKVGRPYLKYNQSYQFQARYEDGANVPLYPFGYGLSYSKFVYSNFKVNKNQFILGENVIVSVDIENISNTNGVEIVQLYINDKFAEVTRPNKELKDFKRVYLKSYEKKTVDFNISADKLAYYHFNGSYKADKGEFELYIGGSSELENYITIKLI